MSRGLWLVPSMVAAFVAARRNCRHRMFVGLQRTFAAGFISLAAMSLAPCAAAQGTSTLVRSATGMAAQVARVSAEIECEDSVSRRLLIEAVIIGVG